MPMRRVKTEFWKQQNPVDYIDTTLTINTYENVSADLGGDKPIRLWYIIVEQTNNGATAEDITLEVTINGTVYTVSGTLNSGTPYFVNVGISLSGGALVFYFGTSAITVGNPNYSGDLQKPLTTSTVGLIRVKQTTSVDATSAQIEVNILYDKLTV